MSVNKTAEKRPWAGRWQMSVSDDGVERNRVRAVSIGAGERKGFASISSGKQEPTRNKVKVTVLDDSGYGNESVEKRESEWPKRLQYAF